MEIRNFVIIAHIDHGKSTLADRMLEVTGTIEKRKMQEQLLDSMELEREKGITIKLQPVRMMYEEVQLNLIDTPGHVDFQYEVSRSLAAVEGAVLLVDASQGVQAQTLSNLYLAIEQGLEIIPVINKIDLPAADVPRVEDEIIGLIGCAREDILRISAKTGEGVEDVLREVVSRVPAAEIDAGDDLRALIFDSVYDDYKGVVTYVRIVEGEVKARDELVFMGTDVKDRVVEAGVFAPDWKPGEKLTAGEIGYIATGLKDVRAARVGDTIALSGSKVEALSEFKIPQPKVFAGLFPKSGDDFPNLRTAMSELQLNDASLQVTQDRLEALGQGFRCGFLGMLHLEIIQERLQREYDLELVVTTPSVSYRVIKKNGEVEMVASAAVWPDPSSIEKVEEQLAEVVVLVPSEQVGAVFELMQEREGILQNQEYLEGGRMQLTYKMPLRELVVDLYDKLKSATSGYGSLSYELSDWVTTDVVKLTVLINKEPAEELASIVARNKAEAAGKRMVAGLKKVVPKQLFAVPLQAAVGGTIVARETLPAQRKDVTGHLYGGDVSRKKKLLEKQKKGKQRLAGGAQIEIPSSAYLELFRK